jgi:tRNA-2-methylthio-N6-dimethylallyladenosine synthase
MYPKSFFIHTIGCQMNVSDSERMARSLTPLGYVPAVSADQADLVVVNTCSVRAKAEQKAFSLLGQLAVIKARRPEMVVVVAGCVAQQEGERLRQRAPHVDLILGTRAIQRLGPLLQRLPAHSGPLVDVEMGDLPDETDGARLGESNDGVSRFVTIMRGCDNFCAYCVVPYVRGREVSRSPEAILHEIRGLCDAGVREVTLLGQNVNSYGAKEGICSFAQLLRHVNAVEGLARIRFTTSHPKDLTPELIDCFATLEKLCPHIHLPVQSGSNPILARMNRNYTREHYLDKVAKLRNSCRQIAITSDIIVGFPGERRADFEATLDLMQQVEFDSVFAFMYSDRPNTPARLLSDKLPEREKRERLHAVLELQERVTAAKHQALLGSVQEVLTDGFSKRPAAAAEDSGEQWTGRTRGNKIVHFIDAGSRADDTANRPGRMVRVRIERALAHSLWGRLERPHAFGSPLKRGDSCCAESTLPD